MRPMEALLILGPTWGRNGAAQVLPGGLYLARPPVQLLSADHAGAILITVSTITAPTITPPAGTTPAGATLRPRRS